MPGDFMAKEATNIVGLVDTYLSWADKNGPPRGHEKYHPSAFGKCLRLMQYQRYAERGYIEEQHEEHAPNRCRIFGNGHSMHDRWRAYFEEIGILRGYWNCTNPLCQMFDDSGYARTDDAASFLMLPPQNRKPRIYGMDHLQGCFKPQRCNCGCFKFAYEETDVVSKEMNFSGHADLILDFSKFDPDRFAGVKQLFNFDTLPTKPIVVDMKTINNAGFQDVAKGQVHPEYCTQLMIYANILDCEYGVLIYENKDNQRTTCYRIDRDSETLFREVQRQAKEMNEMVEVIDKDGQVHHLLPPPRYSKTNKNCKYCNYRAFCHSSPIWSDPNLEQLKTDFYGLLLEEEPDDYYR